MTSGIRSELILQLIELGEKPCDVVAQHDSLRSSDKLGSDPAQQYEHRQNDPVVTIAISDAWKVIADHGKDEGHGHECVLLRSQFGLRRQSFIGLASFLECRNHLLLCRQD